MYIILLALALSVQAKAEVVGAFQTQSGRKAIVTSMDRSGYKDVRIALSPGKKQSPVPSPAGWSLNRDSIGKSGSGEIEIRTTGGTFILPPFGGAFMLQPGKTAKIHFQDGKGAKRAISLPIRGGEIRAFKVLADGLELLVYDQESINEVDKKGRKLFGLSPKGENVLIRVTGVGAGRPKNLASGNPGVYWAEKGRLYKVDEALGEFIKL